MILVLAAAGVIALLYLVPLHVPLYYLSEWLPFVPAPIREITRQTGLEAAFVWLAFLLIGGALLVLFLIHFQTRLDVPSREPSWPWARKLASDRAIRVFT